MGTKRYTVTKRAGPKVAGRTAAAGETLELTAAEAEHELLAGAVTPEGQDLPDAFASTSRKLDRIQEAAAGAGLTAPSDQPEAPAPVPPAAKRVAGSSKPA